jgi:hypothetical protein
MNKPIPAIGTRFKFHSTGAVLYPDFYSLRQAGLDWEGEVVRTYDAWAGSPCIEVCLIPSRELRKLSLNWWHLLLDGPVDSITIQLHEVEDE